jgi:hypothetical protein
LGLVTLQTAGIAFSRVRKGTYGGALSDSKRITAMATTIGQVAAHEAGHCVLSLAIGGVQLVGITQMEGSHPDSCLMEPDWTFATEYVFESWSNVTDFRLTYLVATGGFAGETVHEQAIELRGAADDLNKLRNTALLTDNQIQELTGIAVDVINDNLMLWNDIRNAAIRGIESKKPVVVGGLAMHERFNQIGKKFTSFSALDRLLNTD